MPDAPDREALTDAEPVREVSTPFICDTLERTADRIDFSHEGINTADLLREAARRLRSPSDRAASTDAPSEEPPKDFHEAMRRIGSLPPEMRDRVKQAWIDEYGALLGGPADEAPDGEPVADEVLSIAAKAESVLRDLDQLERRLRQPEPASSPDQPDSATREAGEPE